MIQQEFTELKATARKRLSEAVTLEYAFVQRRKLDSNACKTKQSKLSKNRYKLQKDRIEAQNTTAVQKAVTREQQGRNRQKARERKKRYSK